MQLKCGNYKKNNEKKMPHNSNSKLTILSFSFYSMLLGKFITMTVV